jgi:biotin operon repressor BirA-like protein
MATPLAAQVFAELADGRFHSGEALAAALGVSRSAIWKAAAALKALGSELHAVRNRGYRLVRGAEPLDPAKIRERASTSRGSMLRGRSIRPTARCSHVQIPPMVSQKCCSPNTRLPDVDAADASGSRRPAAPCASR